MANPRNDTTNEVVNACLMDGTVEEYVTLANDFTQDISAVLVTPMQSIFIAFASLWVVIQGLRLVMAISSPSQIIKEFAFLCIAWLLLSQQGPNLVNNLFDASLKVAGSGAAVVMDTASSKNKEAAGTFDPTGLGGMADLVCYTEKAVTNVVGISGTIMKQTTLTNPLPIVYGLILLIPYIMVLIVYFAQVVMAIFRVLFLATISPYLMMAFGFGFFREEAINGLRTLLSSFLVLWGATVAVAVLVYSVVGLDAKLDDVLNNGEGLSLLNEAFLVPVALGWVGTAFLTEATAIANSITRSTLSNTGVGVITAGIAGSGIAAAKAGMSLAGGPAGMIASHGAALGKAVGGAAGSKALAASPRAQRISQIVTDGLEKYNNFVHPEKK
jgi:hypothetical protein